MFPVIIQDSLPAVSLQFQRILRLRVKGDADLGLVVAGLGTMPAGVRKIPLGNVFRPGISVPGFLQVHRNGGLDGDFLVFDHGVGDKLDLSNGHGLVEQLHIEMNLCVECFEYLDDRFKSRIG